MSKEICDQLFTKKKRQYVSLVEVFDFTRQLAEAVDRHDEISVKITLSMRQEPLVELSELDDQIRAIVESQPEEYAIRLSELLSGAEAELPEERALSEQVLQNQRLLERVQEMDMSISRKIDPKRSFYNKYR